MSDTHCHIHHVRWFDISDDATTPNHKCILCEIARADLACEERDRFRKDSEALDLLIQRLYVSTEGETKTIRMMPLYYDASNLPEHLRKRLGGK